MNPRIKVLLMALLVAFLLIGLCACGDNGGSGGAEAGAGNTAGPRTIVGTWVVTQAYIPSFVGQHIVFNDDGTGNYLGKPITAWFLMEITADNIQITIVTEVNQTQETHSFELWWLSDQEIRLVNPQIWYKLKKM